LFAFLTQAPGDRIKTGPVAWGAWVVFAFIGRFSWGADQSDSRRRRAAARPLAARFPVLIYLYRGPEKGPNFGRIGVIWTAPKSAGPVPDFPRKLGKYPIFPDFDPFFPKKIDFPPFFPEIPEFFREFAIVAGKSLAYLQKSLAFEKVEKSLDSRALCHSRWPYSRWKISKSR
jgi:hypothetical protein